MKWNKLGFIWGPDGSREWAAHSALQPTPLLLNDRIIRVFAGFRDGGGVGRVGWVDVDAADPRRICGQSDSCVLDIGAPGTFDDNGVVPCAVVRHEERLLMYYAGYQQATKVPFLAFGGLAESRDGGNTFVRYSPVPVLDRTPSESLFRAAHCVLYEDQKWKVWYAAGSSFVLSGGKLRPRYDTRYIESASPYSFGTDGVVCIAPEGDREYRVGRSTVIKTDGLYRMLYSWANRSEGLQLGYAESTDGIAWTRRDDDVGLSAEDSGWDSTDQCYPALLPTPAGLYMFYNGNDYGKAGFGCALLEQW